MNFTLPIASSSDAVYVLELSVWVLSTPLDTHWGAVWVATWPIGRSSTCAEESEARNVQKWRDMACKEASHCLSGIVKTQKQNFGVLVQQAFGSETSTRQFR